MRPIQTLACISLSILVLTATSGCGSGTLAPSGPQQQTLTLFGYDDQDEGTLRHSGFLLVEEINSSLRAGDDLGGTYGESRAYLRFSVVPLIGLTVVDAKLFVTQSAHKSMVWQHGSGLALDLVRLNNDGTIGLDGGIGGDWGTAATPILVHTAPVNDDEDLVFDVTDQVTDADGYLDFRLTYPGVDDRYVDFYMLGDGDDVAPRIVVTYTE